MRKLANKMWKFLKKYGVFLYFGILMPPWENNEWIILFIYYVIFSDLITLRDSEVKDAVANEMIAKTEEWVNSVRREQKNEK